MVIMPFLPPPRGVTSGQLFRNTLAGSRRGRLLAIGTIGLIGHQIAESLVPVLIGMVVDKAIVPADPAALFLWLGVMAAVFIVLAFSWRLGMRATMAVYAYGTHELRQLVVARTLNPHGMLKRRPTGEILAIASSDADRSGGVAWLISGAGACVAAVISAAVSLLMISVPLGIAVLVASPVILLLMHLLSKPLERRTDREQAASAVAGTLATDLVTGLRTIKGLGAEAAASQRYQDASRASLGATLSAVRSKAGYQAVSSAISAAFLAGTALAAAFMAWSGQISIGQLIAVVGLAQFVQGPMEQLGYVGVELARKRASTQRIADLLNEEPAVAVSAATGEHDAPLTQEGNQPAVSFAGAWGIPAFACRRGELVGLAVADSEAARNLVDLLGFRVAVPPGLVHFSGRDGATFDPTSGRRESYADHHNSPLFRATIGDNVRVDAASVDPAILAVACVHDVVDALENGLETMLSGHAEKLSGGQRQRLVLARSLHQPQPVIVLHDPTTNVDTVTETRIAAGLASFPQKAIVVVTTNPVLLRACTRVVRAEAAMAVSR